MAANRDPLNAALVRQLAPPPAARSLLEFARTIRLPDGPHAGQMYDPATEPAQFALMTAAADLRWQEIVHIAPSQRGKSLCGILVPMLHALVECKESYGYIMPTLDKLQQNWTGKVFPAIVGAGFGDWLPKQGPGSQGGKPAAIVFTDPATGVRAGTLYFLAAGGGGKETALSSVTVRTTGTDEADDFENEGHLSLGKRRGAAFGSKYRGWICSTVNLRKNRDSHPVLDRWKRGTRSRMWFACPFCSRYQPLEWERVKFDDLEARYACQHCPALWTESDRQRALDRFVLVHGDQSVDSGGRPTGEGPSTRALTFRTSDLDYRLGNLAAVAEEYRQANKALSERGDHSPMRQFHYKVLARDYDGDKAEAAEVLTVAGLLTRADACEWGPSRHVTDRKEGGAPTYSRHLAPVPEGAAFCTAGIDVQHDRLYWLLQAVALDGSTWDIGWGYEYSRPDHAPWNRAELHATLDRTARVLREAAHPLTLDLAGVDIGDCPDDIRPWLAGFPKQFCAVKGATGAAMKAEGWDIDGVVWVRDRVYQVHSHNTRELVHGAYRRPNGTAGASHIPFGLLNNASDTAFLKHLCAEMRVADPKTGKEKVRQSGRWDWLDCKRYAHALALWRLRRIVSTRPVPTRRYGVVGKAFAV